MPSYTDKLSVDNSVLMMVDHLTGFISGIRTIAPAAYTNNVTAVCELSHAFGVPTFVLGDEGEYRGHFMEPVATLLADAPRFARTTPSAWRAAGLPDAIAATGRTKVVMGGISLDNCLLQTALDTVAAGYEVYAMLDISGTDDPLVEAAATARLVQAGVTPITWVSWAAEMMGDFAGPHGEAVGKAFARRSVWGLTSAA